ncbi:Bifunctional inhibitor/plant lipid transfer protein/seed storage helical domain-containing protein [Cynara cardunculus var. scolymus]|uniref:Bifunctional inhibitor/plant lipid transfer protein/seed storage helical domain-containing protein n=1 Tax=Cynara cardunculus var. scolymus TaxID=59895 RepID=A0A103Y7F1_CYNCS|nr:Bifunctional inhibitor/plant lipid transfer protein/seed storage helical domain-containing protein [Cynara cardunculus var. scolymus]
MACKMIGMVLAMVLVVSICGGAMAQSRCTSALMGMSSCLNFITGNSSTPASSCCSQLANMVRSQPQCLCQALSGSGSGSKTDGSTFNGSKSRAPVHLLAFILFVVSWASTTASF